jgi:hypothetical protein
MVYLLEHYIFKIMDRIELYIDGFRFADAKAFRDHTISFNDKTYECAAEMFEHFVDILEPNLDNQIESLRKKLRENQYFYFAEEDY